MANGSPSPSRSPQLDSILVPYDLATLHLHLLVEPLPVAAALHAALARAAFGAGVEATHAVPIQTVAQVLAVGQQPAFVVVYPGLSAREDSRHMSRLKHATFARIGLAASWFHLCWIFYFPFFFDSNEVGCLLKPDIRQIKTVIRF